MIFLYIIFITVCVLLTVSVLLQSGKGGGLAGTFGGTSQYLGGRSAATFLTNATTTLATIFMLMSILLGALGTRRGAVDDQTEVQRRMQETAPAQVAPLPQQGADQTPAPQESGQ